MNATESLRQAAQLPAWLEIMKEQLRTEITAQNEALMQVRQSLDRQNAQLEKLVEVMLTTAETLQRRLDQPTSSKS